jgi:hypothetical protein
MPLPTTGNPISLIDIATEFGGTAPHSLSEYYGAGGTAGSGAQSIKAFHGLSAAITATISAGAASADISGLFGSDWTTSEAKVLNVNSGVTHGILTIPGTMGGTLTINNNGTIQGTGGGAGAAGGNAISNSASGVTIVNNGTISGGGGGGGTGGVGGNSTTSTSSTLREPTSGANYNASNYHWRTSGVCGGAALKWNGSTITTGHGGTSHTSGSYTYYRDAYQGGPPAWQICGAPTGALAFADYAVYRTSTTTTTSTVTGGAGGSGGVGAGYGQSATSGASGVAVGGAGDGGTGGTGGAFGAAGSTGGTGTNGTTTNGSTGAAGGAAGAAVSGTAVTYTDNGTTNGSVST